MSNINNISEFFKKFGGKLAIAVALLAGWALPGYATHIVGGDMTYRCLGNDRYEVTLMVYRDCIYGDPEADFDDPASIAIYDAWDKLQVHLGTLGQILIPFNSDDTIRIQSDCLMDGEGVCVHRTVYKMEVELPFTEGGYNLVYQRCCRNETLANIIDPLETGATFVTHISEESLASCNSAPEFKEWPPIYICVNEPLTYDHSAIDSDGDQLVYRLCTPYSGATREHPLPQPAPKPPYDSVMWKSPYNLDNLLGGTALSIDQNGILTATPNTIGQFLVGICVEEYRDGKLIGETRRDFEYNVIDCSELSTTNFSIDTATVCADVVDVTLRDNSMGIPDDTPISYSITSDKGLSLLLEGHEVSFQVNGRQTLIITQIAEVNSSCTSRKTQSILIDVEDTGLGFDDSLVVCAGSSVALNPGYSDQYSYSWSPTTYLEYADGPNPIASPEETITYEVEVTDHQRNCTITESITIVVLPNPGVTADFDVEKECDSRTVMFINKSTGSETFIWTFGDPTNPDFSSNERDPVYTYPSGGTYDAVLTIPGDDCNTIRTRRLPITGEDFVDFENDIESCGPSLIDLNTGLNPLYKYQWDPHPLIADVTEAVPEVYLKEDETFTVTVIDPLNDTCTISGILHVSIGDQLVVDLGDSIFICEPGTLELNRNGNPSLIYEWSPAGPLDDPSSYNPTATITEEVRFVAKITDPNDPDCMVRIPLQVRFGIDDGGFRDGDSLTICDSSSFFLNPGADPSLVYVWTPEEGLDDPTSPNPIASPTESTTYSVVVTDSNNICRQEKSIYIEIVESDIVLDFDAVYNCEGLMVSFINQSKGATNYEWHFGDPSNPDFVSTEENPTYTYPSQGVYEVELRSADDPNCTAIRALRLALTGEDPMLVEVDTFSNVCPGDSITLSARTEFVDSLTWCDPNGVELGSSDDLRIEVTVGGTYQLKASMGDCEYVDEVFVDLRSLNFTIDKDGDICSGDPAQITINNTSEFRIDSISWEPADSIVQGQGNETVVVRPVSTTTYWATAWFSDGCVVTDSVTVPVSDFERFAVTADPDSIFFGESSTLTATLEDGATYTWSPSDVLQSPNSNTTVATPDQTTTFTVEITDANGCTETKQVTVVVIVVTCEPPNIFLPNAFSPNGDQVNEVLFLRGKYIESMDLFIYDRWGQLVFESHNPSDGWDGTYKGKLLAPDVYGYDLRVQCIGGDQHSEKGNVTILH